jgi:hypothetical protein
VDDKKEVENPVEVFDVLERALVVEGEGASRLGRMRMLIAPTPTTVAVMIVTSERKPTSTRKSSRFKLPNMSLERRNALRERY